MTTVREHHREYSLNVVRDLHSRPISPYQTKFGSNLDLLLEDLQNSVSQTNNVTQLHSSQLVNKVNRPITPSQDQNNKQYYTSSVSKVYQKNINQLDNLLNDLERERDNSLERHKTFQTTNVGIDSGLSESSQGQQKIVKTTTFHETGNKTVARELVYDPPPGSSSSTLHYSRSRGRSPGYERQLELENQIIPDSSFTNGIDRLNNTPAAHSESYYSESNTLSNRSLTPKVNYTEHVTESGPEVLHNLELDKGMLPPRGTKVTTTVRTYTYELPENQDHGVINKKITLKDEHMSKTTTLPLTPAERDIPLAIEAPPPSSSLTTYRSDASYPSQVDGVTGLTSNKALYYKKESKSSNTSYYPGAPDPNALTRLTAPDDSRPVQVYQETVSRKGPPGTSDPYGMNTVTYRYTSSQQNSNIRYPPAEREPLLPQFPIDHHDSHSDGNPPKRVEDLMASFGDTTHSDTFTYVDKRREVAEKPITPTRIEEKRTLVPLKQELEPSKNVEGSPVYYPPNHEMFVRKEEGAAWQAGGGWARGRGEYEYKAENRSKQSSKKGGAVVPVCLPLCCAMPCSIM